MSTLETRTETVAEIPDATRVDMKLEIVLVPVSDVDRAKRFYRDLGWRLDLDYTTGNDYRVIQFTPPGSECSIMVGKNITTASPGSLQDVHLIVADVEVACADLRQRGVEVSGPFHEAGGVFHHAGSRHRLRGLRARRESYASYASFNDPDGNGWILQEVTARLSGDVQRGDPRFTSEVVDAIRHMVDG